MLHWRDGIGQVMSGAWFPPDMTWAFEPKSSIFVSLHQTYTRGQAYLLAPLLYNINTNNQPMDQNSERFIYADNLCVTS